MDQQPLLEQLSLATGLVVFNPALGLEIAARVFGWVPLPIARLTIGTLCWTALLLVARFGTPSQAFRHRGPADVERERH